MVQTFGGLADTPDGMLCDNGNPTGCNCERASAPDSLRGGGCRVGSRRPAANAVCHTSRVPASLSLLVDMQCGAGRRRQLETKARAEGGAAAVCRHGLSSTNTALFTSDCGTTRDPEHQLALITRRRRPRRSRSTLPSGGTPTTNGQRPRTSVRPHPHKHGLSSDKMALVTSDCGATRSPGSKWP